MPDQPVHLTAAQLRDRARLATTAGMLCCIAMGILTWGDDNAAAKFFALLISVSLGSANYLLWRIETTPAVPPGRGFVHIEVVTPGGTTIRQTRQYGTFVTSPTACLRHVTDDVANELDRTGEPRA